jgi:hypothetical protein
MNKDIKESANIKPGPSKEIFYIIIRNYGVITFFKKFIETQKILTTKD